MEYWKDLDLLHNLGVMHIEKNICDSIIGTLLNIEGKTKDTLKSRIDLTHLGIRKDLQVQDEGKPRDMAPAVYVLDKVKRKEFCVVLSRVRFPHGFASNPERRVSADGNKVQGLKTHDCHVLLQRVYLLSLEDWAALTYTEQLQSWDNSSGNSAVGISG